MRTGVLVIAVAVVVLSGCTTNLDGVRRLQ